MRKKVVMMSTFETWEEANEALRLIAEKKSVLDAKVAQYNEEEARARKALDDFCNPISAEIKDIEENVRLFCEEHRADAEFGGKKSVTLPNGTVSFRLGTPKVLTVKGFTWKTILDMVKKSKLAEKYIRSKEEINKEQIIQDYQTGDIDNPKLRNYGMQVDQEETFGYEINLASGQPS